MNIQIVKGNFSSKDILEIITGLIHVKIRYHEQKISTSQNEEDVKMREKKIKQLQESLQQAREQLQHLQQNVSADCTLSLAI
ncbi:MAG TPA: hypothetical protein PKC39_13165 [Ferruginibacter sp.]|nr:hypothetical protein [Ferruginibacter sp.]HMP21903.1 hypothetical protein [Ferruginibacter sp.]